jgi:predicted DNA-binding transcriptional regulator AlpA
VTADGDDAVLVGVDDGFARLLGWRASDLVGVSSFELVVDVERQRPLRRIIQAAGRIDGAVTVARARNGERVPLVYSTRVLEGGLWVAEVELWRPGGEVVRDVELFSADELDGALLEQARGRPRPRPRTATVELEQLARRVEAALERAHELAADRWLDVRAAEAYTSLSESTLDRLVDEGALPRAGTKGKRLFRKSVLDALLEAGGVLALLLALLLLGCAARVDLACDIARVLGCPFAPA